MIAARPLLSPESATGRGSQRFAFPAERGFHAAALVWLVAIAALWLIGWAIAKWTPAPVPDPRAAAEFLPWHVGGLQPEPDERRLYMLLTLLSPLLLLAAWMAARRFLPGVAAPASDRRGQGGGASWGEASAVAVLLLGGSAAYLCASAPILQAAFRLPDAAFFSAAGAAVALWLALSRRRRRSGRLWRNLSLIVSLPLALAGGVAYRLFDYHTAAFINAANMNTTLYPIVAAAHGQRAFVDYVSQYGCYGEMLKPWFALIGLSVSKISLTLAGLQALSLAVTVFVLSRLARSAWLTLLGTVALAWLEETWQEVSNSAYDPYLQYFPVRVVFPALSLLAAWAYLRRPTGRRAAGVGLVGGLGAWWNVDSGAVVLLSLAVLLIVETLQAWRRPDWVERRRRLRHLGWAAGGVALALAGFYLVLCLEARRLIALDLMVHYQKIFYISGFNMLRMPAQLHPWHLVVSVYLLGLTVSLGRVAAGRALGVGHGMILYVSVLGIGLFSYYQGRSHDVVLMLCLWPSVLLAVLLCDRHLAAVRYGLLPRPCPTALPALLLLTMCAASLWQGREKIIQAHRFHWTVMREQPNANSIPANAAYLKGAVPPGQSSSVLSVYQAIYDAATGQRSALTGESLYECLLKTDLAYIENQVRSRRVRHLFTGQMDFAPDLPALGPDFFQVLYGSYRLTGRSPNAQMLHWEARSDAEVRAAPPGGFFARDYEGGTRLRVSPPAAFRAALCPTADVLLDDKGQCATAPAALPGGLLPGGDWAIEMRLTPAASQPDAACLISNHPGAGHDGLTVQHAGGGGLYQCFFGTGHEYVGSALFALAPGQEHYLMLSKAASAVSIYVDGQLRQALALPAPITPSITPLTIGDWTKGGRRFAGEIAEVKIHNQALSSQVAALTWQEIMARNTKSSFTSPPPAP